MQEGNMREQQQADENKWQNIKKKITSHTLKKGTQLVGVRDLPNDPAAWSALCL